MSPQQQSVPPPLGMCPIVPGGEAPQRTLIRSSSMAPQQQSVVPPHGVFPIVPGEETAAVLVATQPFDTNSIVQAPALPVAVLQPLQQLAPAPALAALEPMVPAPMLAALEPIIPAPTLAVEPALESIGCGELTDLESQLDVFLAEANSLQNDEDLSPIEFHYEEFGLQGDELDTPITTPAAAASVAAPAVMRLPHAPVLQQQLCASSVRGAGLGSVALSSQRCTS